VRITRTPTGIERSLAWAASGLFAFTTPALATPPAPVPCGTPRVELWHGTQQVGTFPPQPVEEPRATPDRAEEGLPLPAPLLLPSELPATNLPGANNTTSPPSLPLPVAPVQSAAPVPPEGVVEAQHVVPAAPAEAAPAPRESKPTATAAREVTAPPTQAESAPAPASTPEREAPARGLSSELIVQIACVFGAAFLGPLFSVALLLILLRRHGQRSGPLFRIEHVGGLPSAEAMSILAAREALAGAPGWGSRLGEPAHPPAAAVRAAEVKAGEAFDLGPTCEQEQQNKALQAEQQEQALLLQFYEANLQLQAQIERSRQADD
jgi:hypothetical protein